MGKWYIYKGLPIRELKIKTNYNGCLSVGEVKLHDNSILTVISLYALLESGYSITTLHRMLSDLTLLLDGKIGKERKIILGGDFNASLQWDEQQKGESHRILFERIKNFGLVDSVELFHKTPIETWRNRQAKRKWQLDYFFVSENIVNNITSADVIVNDEIVILSDHNPIIVTFDI